MLEESCNEGRALFLCYPDDFEVDPEKEGDKEDDKEDDKEEEDEEDEEDGELLESLGLRCLRAFEGDVVRAIAPRPGACLARARCIRASERRGGRWWRVNRVTPSCAHVVGTRV